MTLACAECVEHWKPVVGARLAREGRAPADLPLDCLYGSLLL